MLASIEQHYASAGVSVSRFGAGMPDHISTELEFLALLCGREADAWEKGDLKSARRMQDRQRRFMEKHPARWLPALSAALAERDGGIFREAVEAAHSLVAHDIDFLAALRPRLREGEAG
jgi:TorA maturation chaperone TorD